MSETENDAPEAPIIGTLGIMRSTAYTAVNMEIIAIVFEFSLFWSISTMWGLPLSLCNFLHSMYLE
jgi:hypothetical protein